MIEKLLFPIVFSTTMAFSDTVGDFAPLEVGNRWQYSGSWYSAGGCCTSTSSAILRSIEILTRSSIGDTSVFKLRVNDSTHTTITGFETKKDTIYKTEVTSYLLSFGDSLVLTSDSLGKSRPIPNFNNQFGFYLFLQHNYPDSIVIDTLGTKMVKVGNRFASYLDSIWRGPQTTAVYAKNVGLVDYRMRMQATRDITTEAWHLVDFRNVLVTGISNHSPSNRKRGIWKFATKVFAEKGVDARGRRIADGNRGR